MVPKSAEARDDASSAASSIRSSILGRHQPLHGRKQSEPQALIWTADFHRVRACLQTRETNVRVAPLAREQDDKEAIIGLRARASDQVPHEEAVSSGLPCEERRQCIVPNDTDQRAGETRKPPDWLSGIDKGGDANVGNCANRADNIKG